MKRIIISVCLILSLSISVSAQKNDLITVRAGTKVLDYFPVKERYHYQEFTAGQVVFKNGIANTTQLNYNFLLGEIEFIQSRDTLTITRKKDIRFIVVAQDTFFYDNGYIELVSGGNIRVGLKQYIKFKEVLKKGAYGVPARNVSIDSYNSMATGGNFYELIPDEDILLQKTMEYYLSTASGGFVPFNRKNVMDQFPQKVDIIKGYLKSYKVNFESGDDLLRLAAFLRGL
ncbi:MAG: hypothetical protein WCS03_14810 [Bacteroidota bacterium]